MTEKLPNSVHELHEPYFQGPPNRRLSKHSAIFFVLQLFAGLNLR